MRHLLSLGIVFALLFSTYVIANSPIEGTATPLEASGSVGGGFNWDDIDTSHKGWGTTSTKHYDEDLRSKTNPTIYDRKMLRLKHPVRILGSSRASGGRDLYFAPMTNTGATLNKDFTPGKATDYISGPKVDDRSRIHVGKPFKTDANNIEIFNPSYFTQTPEQEEKYHRDAKENEKNHISSAHEQQQGGLGSFGRGPLAPSSRQQSEPKGRGHRHFPGRGRDPSSRDQDSRSSRGGPVGNRGYRQNPSISDGHHQGSPTGGEGGYSSRHSGRGRGSRRRY